MVILLILATSITADVKVRLASTAAALDGETVVLLLREPMKIGFEIIKIKILKVGRCCSDFGKNRSQAAEILSQHAALADPSMSTTSRPPPARFTEYIVAPIAKARRRTIAQPNAAAASAAATRLFDALERVNTASMVSGKPGPTVTQRDGHLLDVLLY